VRVGQMTIFLQARVGEMTNFVIFICYPICEIEGITVCGDKENIFFVKLRKK
jgi:hypothetical protein